MKTTRFKKLAAFICALPFLLLGSLQISTFGATDEKTSFFYIGAAQTNIWTSISKTDLTDSFVKVQTKNTVKALGIGVTVGRQFNKWHDVRLEIGVAQDNGARMFASALTPDAVSRNYTWNYKATIVPIVSTYNFIVPIYKDRISFGVGASLGAIYARLEDAAWFSGVSVGRSMASSSITSIKRIKQNQWDFIYGLNVSLKADFTERLFGRLAFGYFNSNNLGSPKQISIATGWKF